MSMIAIVFKNLWCRVKGTFIDMYEGGIGNLIAEKRYFKAIIDICLIFSFMLLAIAYPSTIVIIVFSYGFLLTILNRITAVEDHFVLVDLTKPFLTIYLLTWIRFISFASSVLSIPLMTRQIEERLGYAINS